MCPITTTRELTGGRPFVVLSPHPDDETLGTGGLIAAARTAGQEVDVIVVTDGSGSHPRSKQYPSKRLVDLRYSEVHRAGLALGLSRTVSCSWDCRIPWRQNRAHSSMRRSRRR